MSNSSSKAPDPPLVPGERVKVTHVSSSLDERKLGKTGTVREWRGYEVIVDLDSSGLQKSGPGPLLRLSPGFLVRLEEPADTALGAKMAFVCARCGELRYKRYDRKIQYECPKCIEKKMYHPQLRKARKKAGRLTPLEKDKKPMVCPECGSVKYKDPEITRTECKNCKRGKMLSKSEREKRKKPTALFVCKSCENKEYRVPGKTKKCRQCGEKMLSPPERERKDGDKKSGSAETFRRTSEIRLNKERQKKELGEGAVEKEEESGYVYVLVSSEKPDLVKIGSTERSPKKRAEEISSSTGVAMPYIVVYKAETNNHERVEKAVHNRLSDKRVNPNREFFKVETRQVIEIIEQEMRTQK